MLSFCPTFNTALRCGIFVVLETVKNQNLLISAPYVLFLMIKFCPTSGYYIIQKEQLYTTKEYNIYKSFPKYLKDMLTFVSLYTLLEELIFYLYVNLLLLLIASTLAFRYFASKKQNSLPNDVRSEPTLSGFRRLLKAISFQT